MAKKTKLEIDYNNPLITLGVKDVDFLIGRVFEHCELVGMTDRQLGAFKRTLRSVFWDWFNTYVPNEHGMVDPSKQGRIEQGVEPSVTTAGTTTVGSYYFNAN